MDKKIDDILKNNQLSVTSGRRKILELFLHQDGALSHSDIEKKAGEKFDRVTVYRTIDLLKRNGLIDERLRFLIERCLQRLLVLLFLWIENHGLFIF